MARFRLNNSGQGFVVTGRTDAGTLTTDTSITIADIASDEHRTYIVSNEAEVAVRFTVVGAGTNAADADAALEIGFDFQTDHQTRRRHPNSNHFVVEGGTSVHVDLHNTGAEDFGYDISAQSVHGTSVGSGDDLLILGIGNIRDGSISS